MRMSRLTNTKDAVSVADSENLELLDAYKSDSSENDTLEDFSKNMIPASELERSFIADTSGAVSPDVFSPYKTGRDENSRNLVNTNIQVDNLDAGMPPLVDAGIYELNMPPLVESHEIKGIRQQYNSAIKLEENWDASEPDNSSLKDKTWNTSIKYASTISEPSDVPDNLVEFSQSASLYVQNFNDNAKMSVSAPDTRILADYSASKVPGDSNDDLIMIDKISKNRTKISFENIPERTPFCASESTKNTIMDAGIICKHENMSQDSAAIELDVNLSLEKINESENNLMDVEHVETTANINNDLPASNQDDDHVVTGHELPSTRDLSQEYSKYGAIANNNNDLPASKQDNDYAVTGHKLASNQNMWHGYSECGHTYSPIIKSDESKIACDPLNDRRCQEDAIKCELSHDVKPDLPMFDLYKSQKITNDTESAEDESISRTEPNTPKDLNDQQNHSSFTETDDLFHYDDCLQEFEPTETDDLNIKNYSFTISDKQELTSDSGQVGCEKLKKIKNDEILPDEKGETLRLSHENVHHDFASEEVVKDKIGKVYMMESDSGNALPQSDSLEKIKEEVEIAENDNTDVDYPLKDNSVEHEQSSKLINSSDNGDHSPSDRKDELPKKQFYDNVISDDDYSAPESSLLPHKNISKETDEMSESGEVSDSDDITDGPSSLNLLDDVSPSSGDINNDFDFSIPVTRSRDLNNRESSAPSSIASYSLPVLRKAQPIKVTHIVSAGSDGCDNSICDSPSCRFEDYKRQETPINVNVSGSTKRKGETLEHLNVVDDVQLLNTPVNSVNTFNNNILCNDSQSYDDAIGRLDALLYDTNEKRKKYTSDHKDKKGNVVDKIIHDVLPVDNTSTAEYDTPENPSPVEEPLVEKVNYIGLKEHASESLELKKEFENPSVEPAAIEDSINSKHETDHIISKLQDPVDEECDEFQSPSVESAVINNYINSKSETDRITSKLEYPVNEESDEFQSPSVESAAIVHSINIKSETDHIISKLKDPVNEESDEFQSPSIESAAIEHSINTKHETDHFIFKLQDPVNEGSDKFQGPSVESTAIDHSINSKSETDHIISKLEDSVNQKSNEFEGPSVESAAIDHSINIKSETYHIISKLKDPVNEQSDEFQSPSVESAAIEHSTNSKHETGPIISKLQNPVNKESNQFESPSVESAAIDHSINSKSETDHIISKLQDPFNEKSKEFESPSVESTTIDHSIHSKNETDHIIFKLQDPDNKKSNIFEESFEKFPDILKTSKDVELKDKSAVELDNDPNLQPGSLFTDLSSKSKVSCEAPVSNPPSLCLQSDHNERFNLANPENACIKTENECKTSDDMGEKIYCNNVANVNEIKANEDILSKRTISDQTDKPLEFQALPEKDEIVPELKPESSNQEFENITASGEVSEYQDIFDNGQLLKKVIDVGKKSLPPPLPSEVAYVSMQCYLTDGTLIEDRSCYIVIGENDTVAGVDLCLRTMHPGAVVYLKVGSRYAYREFLWKFGDFIIYPDTDLEFRIKLIEVKEFPSCCPNNYKEIQSICVQKKMTGNLYFTAGDNEIAAECYNHCLRHISGVPNSQALINDVKNNLAQCYIRLSKYYEAMNLLRDVLKEDPSNTKALQRMTRCLEVTGDIEGALEYAEKAYKASKDRASENVLKCIRQKYNDYKGEMSSFSKRMLKNELKEETSSVSKRRVKTELEEEMSSTSRPMVNNGSKEEIQPIIRSSGFWSWKKVLLISIVIGTGIMAISRLRTK